MKTVLLLGGPAAGQRVEVHGCMKTVMGHSLAPAIDTIYNVVPLLSHGEVHWFGVLDGADPLALLIDGYTAKRQELVQEVRAFLAAPYGTSHAEAARAFSPTKNREGDDR